jgi:POT family proton-dependent oligopeptide transporter
VTEAIAAAADTNTRDLPSRRDTGFIGHPVGLGWLSASEFWERFSYYGMQTLLVLYLTYWLFTPGHVEHVWGFSVLRSALNGLYGRHLTAFQLASNINGLYSGLVYVTPLAGGYLADRVIGRTNAVTAGAILMVFGGFLMALDSTFVPALLCLLVGVGLFKGNIASQVGDLYSIDDTRRADGFQIYFLGIQLAVILSPTICGYLGQQVNWHLGFAAAGGGMLLGLLIYLAGRRTFPPETLRKQGDRVARPPLTNRDWKAVMLLVALLPVLAISIVGNQEIFNAYLVWGGKTFAVPTISLVYPWWGAAGFQWFHYSFPMPITWLVSMDAIVSTVAMIGVIWFWRWYGRRWKEPDEITKIVIGTAISALGPLVLAGCAAVATRTHHPVPLYWALGFHILNDIGFSNVLPVGLALYSRAAPKGLGGIMIGVYYVHLFIGNMLVGYLGAKLGTMPDTAFWLMHVGLMAVSAVILFVVRLAFAHLVAPHAADVAAAPT